MTHDHAHIATLNAREGDESGWTGMNHLACPEVGTAAAAVAFAVASVAAAVVEASVVAAAAAPVPVYFPLNLPP